MDIPGSVKGREARREIKKSLKLKTGKVIFSFGFPLLIVSEACTKT